MIRLATVFSGIGAIEHALYRMGLEHKIVFACDNGDVEILTKDVGMNIDAISSELKSLTKTIESIRFNDEVDDLYKEQLSGMLKEALKENKKIFDSLDTITEHQDLIAPVLQSIINMKDVKAARVKEYKAFLSELSAGSEQQSSVYNKCAHLFTD